MDARELEYDLPEERIAQSPLPERDEARLLVLCRETGAVEHRRVRELPELLVPSLLVVNDTRVLRARLLGAKPSGGRVELLLLERRGGQGAEETWTALARGAKSLRAGMPITIAPRLRAEIRAVGEGTVEVALVAPEGTVAEAIEAVGHVPLPPYIRRPDAAADVERYQTVFARSPGSIAAPTAGLHFSPALVGALEAAGCSLASVTLHVGTGTFAPLRAERLEDHAMHEERWEVPEPTAAAIAAARAEGRPVVAVGTTVLRTLESAFDGEVRAGSGRTRLFVHPPYRVRAADALFTNFHLPRSTLLALVMAVAGVEPVRAAYRTAVEQGYRFFSYGDAMLVRSEAHRRERG